MITEVEAKPWGNSLGVIIPIETVRTLKIKPGEKIIADFGKKENPLKELFGTLKSKKSTDQMIKEVRKELESKWM